MFIDPELMFGINPNFEFILMAIIGGRGSLLGPIAGSLLLKPLAEITRVMFGSGKPGLFLMVYGALLVITIIFLPKGLMGLIQRFYQRRRLAYITSSGAGNPASRGNEVI